MILAATYAMLNVAVEKAFVSVRLTEPQIDLGASKRLRKVFVECRGLFRGRRGVLLGLGKESFKVALENGNS